MLNRKTENGMEEDEITIRFARRKLDALKVALYAEGKDLDQSLEKYIGKLYADKVPKNERAKIERLIQEDVKTEQEDRDRFVAVRLTDGEETVCFTASVSNSFYGVAGQLKDMLKGAENSTLDSLLEYFIDAYVMDDRLFDIIASAPDDPLLQAVMELNFKDCTMSFKGRGADQPVCYEMEDAEKAYRRAESIPKISRKAREELFRDYLQAREINAADMAEQPVQRL